MGNSCQESGNVVLIGDIGAKALSGAAIVTDPAADRSYLLVAGPAIDRDGNAVTGQAPRDHSSQAPRAARHQSDTPMRHCHLVLIPFRSAHQVRTPASGWPIRDDRISSYQADISRCLRVGFGQAADGGRAM
jgi:hypothetical protein